MQLRKILYLVLLFLATLGLQAQEDSPFVSYDVPAQNLLKFNRFLINPTFSTVRENKSYINFLHRNQSVSFDDNNQAYFLSYSGRVSDRSGMGLSLYTQRTGLFTNFGVMANYAYGIKLSDKSNFTFGANLAYYNSGFDWNRASAIDPNDPSLNGLQDSNLLSFQPGFNISYGRFDFGMFAENLFDYNIKSNRSVTEFGDKTFSGHLQYTHEFTNGDGIFEHGRLMPLARARQVGAEELVLGGSLILDLPKLGWLQTGYDSFYGVSGGIGFNINQRISIGYTMEKGMSNNFNNFGLTHEISFAYSFTPNLTEDRVLLEKETDQLVATEVRPEDVLTAQEVELEILKTALAENDKVIAELMFRQDSIEASRNRDLERRFAMVMNMVRNETQGKRPDLEEKAREMYLGNDGKSATDQSQTARTNSDSKPNGINNAKPAKDALSGQQVAAGKDRTAPKTYPGKEVQEDYRDQDNNGVRSGQQGDGTANGNLAQSGQHSDRTGNGRPIKKTGQQIDGVADGYYVVANVYKGQHYRDRFIADLAQNGVQADYFENPRNGLKYVYLERYDTWQEAQAAHGSQMHGTYGGDMWIMKVAQGTDSPKGYASQGTDNLGDQATVNLNANSDNAGPRTETSRIPGLGTGYYIIANVFANTNSARNFVKQLNQQGLNASYFVNPENNYKYVYLKIYDSWETALTSYYSQLDATYTDKMWIFRVAPEPAG